MTNDRVNRLTALLREKELDAVFISNESNVRYLSGYTNHDAFLFIAQNGDRRLLTDFRYDEQARTECPDYQVLSFVKGKGGIYQMLEQSCAENGVKRLGFEAAALSHADYLLLTDTVKNVTTADCGPLVESLRYVKDEKEEALIRYACTATDRVFSKLCGFIRPGITEKQLEWQLLTIVNEEGCDSSFQPIVVAGEHGSLPHGMADERKLQKGEFITMDFGCMYRGYHADMTRTVFLGRPDAKQKEIYDVVLEAHLRGMDAFKPGIPGSVPDAAARDYITERGYGENFGHGVGHGLGLDIHEEPFMNTSCRHILKEGCFVTMEPGVYLPGWGGVRIEDTVKITRDGGESLFTSEKGLICL